MPDIESVELKRSQIISNMHKTGQKALNHTPHIFTPPFALPPPYRSQQE